MVTLQVEKLPDPDAAVAFLEESLNDKIPISRLITARIQSAPQSCSMWPISNFQGAAHLVPLVERWRRVGRGQVA